MVVIDIDKYIKKHHNFVIYWDWLKIIWALMLIGLRVSRYYQNAVFVFFWIDGGNR